MNVKCLHPRLAAKGSAVKDIISYIVQLTCLLARRQSCKNGLNEGAGILAKHAANI